MTIKWLEESEAERLFETTLSSNKFMVESGYVGCHTAKDTEEYVRGFFTAGFSESPTAKALLEYVEISPKTIYVVGMRGGYQCFDSTAGEQQDLPTVFIDVNGKLEIFVRSPHGMQIKFGTKPQAPSREDHRVLMLEGPMAGKVAPGGAWHHLNEKRDNPLIVRRVSLDNRIAALHEFGHAKQWLERPHLFDAQRVVAPTVSAETVERSVRSNVNRGRLDVVDKAKRQRIWDSIKRPTPGKPWVPGDDPHTQADPRLKPDSFSEDIRTAATKRFTVKTRDEKTLKVTTTVDKHVAVKSDRTQVTQQKGSTGNWGRVIEMDNMARHEWPICREIGVPYRSNYRDLEGTTTAEASMTSQILLKARALEQQPH